MNDKPKTRRPGRPRKEEIEKGKALWIYFPPDLVEYLLRQHNRSVIVSIALRQYLDEFADDWCKPGGE